MLKKILSLALVASAVFVIPAAASATPSTKVSTVAVAAPSTQAVPATLRTKYAYFNSTDRVVFEGRMQVIKSGGAPVEQKAFSVVAYTERKSGTKWVRYTMCGSQDFTFVYSIRMRNGQHPSPMDFSHYDRNAPFGSYEINGSWYGWQEATLSMYAKYSVDDARCKAPWNSAKSATFTTLEFD